MSAHTPGPWLIETVHTSSGICHKIGPFPPKSAGGKERNACIYADYPSKGNPADVELEANARLIAAAPDMYAVLRELAECSQYWSDYDVPLGIHDRIMAALAKAGGQ